VAEILGEILKALLEPVAELVICGPGYLLVKWIRPDLKTEPEGCLSWLCGILFWAVVVLAIWAVVAIFQK
jgi:hypothetical protein